MTSPKVKENIAHLEDLSDLPGDALHPKKSQRALEEAISPHLHSKTLLVVVALGLIQFGQVMQLVAAGAFASDVALAVGDSEGLDSWMLTAITIVFVVAAPPISQAADYWGRRWLLIGLCLIAFVGAIITSRATSMGMAIAGEAIVGLSFASVPLTFAVASEVLPHRHRLAGQSAINAMSGLGGVFSLLLGAALIRDNGSGAFRTLYYINAGIFLAAAVVTFILYSPPMRELQTSLTTKEKLSRLDWTGYSITLFAAVLFVMGLSWAENPYSWQDAHVLGPFVLGTILFGALAIYSWRIRKDGFLHHDLFSRDRNLALSLVAVFCEGLIFGTGNIYVAFQLAVVYRVSEFKLALIFSLSLMLYAVSSPIGAIICSRYKQVRSLIVVGFASFFIFSITMATSTLDNVTAYWGIQVFFGVGLGLVLCAIVTAAQLSAPPELISIASGLMASIRSLGVTIAVAIGAAISHTQVSKLLPAKVAAAALGNGLPKSSIGQLLGALASQNSTDMISIPGISPNIIQAAVVAVREAYLESFHAVWYAAIGFAAGGLVISFFFINPVTDLNYTIDAPVESETELYG